MTAFSFKLGRKLIYIKNSWNLEGLIQYQIHLIIKLTYLLKIFHYEPNMGNTVKQKITWSFIYRLYPLVELQVY